MNDIDRWFDATAKKSSKMPTLYTSLLTGRVFSYFGYRMRFSLILMTVRSAVHAVEFFVLLTSLGGLATFTVMMLRIGGVVVGGAWWGLLEVMRDRIRFFARAGEREESEREIGRWLVLSVLVALILVIGAAIALQHYFPSHGSKVGQLYALLIIVELGIDLPVRVLHSGVFATRRVYRPVWSMFAPLVVQLAVLGTGFYFYPGAAMITAIVVSNAIGIWITVHYTIEVYRLSGLRPRVDKPRWTFWRRLPKIPPWKSITATLSGTGLHMDGILVLSIVGVYGTDARSFDLTAAVASWSHVDAFKFFYLALPLFRGSYSGAGVFYFDFVRLRSSPALREFQVGFFHRVLRVMPLVALYFWALAAILGLFVLHNVPVTFLLALIPLFVVRAMIGTYQIRMFAEGHHAVHIALLAFLSFLLYLVWITPNPAGDLVEITAAMLTQLILLINLQHLQDRRDLALPTLVALSDWIAALRREPDNVAVGAIEIPEWATSRQKSAAIRLMEDTFNERGHFAYQSATQLLFYTRALDESPQLTMQATAGGAATRGRLLDGPASNGRGALDRAVREGWIRPTEDRLPRLANPGALISEFTALFPDGLVTDLATGGGARDLRSLDHRLLAQLLPMATRSLTDGANVVFTEGRWITPVFHEGVLRLLFVLPPDPDPDQFTTWKATLRGWHLSTLKAETPVAADHA
ncbi:MAG: hypothetical protein AB7G47_03185 [Mycolicibacterium sp.]|uniref:hypothetical protein n=1 Tax=Mycolicibacterium sp. TaxID=2320850 RepID=UPI003D0D96BE